MAPTSCLVSTAALSSNLPILAKSSCVFFCKASVNGSAGLIDEDGMLLLLPTGLLLVAKLRIHVARASVAGRTRSGVHSINRCCCIVRTTR